MKRDFSPSLQWGIPRLSSSSVRPHPLSNKEFFHLIRWTPERTGGHESPARPDCEDGKRTGYRGFGWEQCRTSGKSCLGSTREGDMSGQDEGDLAHHYLYVRTPRVEISDRFLLACMLKFALQDKEKWKIHFPRTLTAKEKRTPPFLGRENKKIVLLFISTDGRTAVFRWGVRTAPGLDIPPFLLWSTTVAPSPSFLFLLLLCVGPWGGGLTWAGQCGLWKCPPPLPS